MTYNSKFTFQIDQSEYDKLYVEVKKVLQQQDPKLCQILDELIEEERGLANSKLKAAEERLTSTSNDVAELVHHLEESDNTISSLREDVLNKDVIIENLEETTRNYGELRDKYEKMESTLFETKLELNQMHKRCEELSNKSSLDSRKLGVDLDNCKAQITSLNYEVEWKTQEITNLNKKVDRADELVSHARQINSEKESIIEDLRNQLVRKSELYEQLYSENLCEKNIMDIFNNLKKQNELLLEKVNVYDVKINQILESTVHSREESTNQQKPTKKNKKESALQVLISERSQNDLKLLKFEDLVKNDGRNESLESLNHLTQELEKQVSEIKESDFDNRLKQSINQYEMTIKSLNDTNQDLNIRYQDQINKCTNLQKRIDTLNHENRDLKEEINEFEPVFNKMASTGGELNTQEKDSVISKLSKKMVVLRESNDTLSSHVNQLEKQIQDNNRSYAVELDHLRQENETLQGYIRKYKNILGDKIDHKSNYDSNYNNNDKNSTKPTNQRIETADHGEQDRDILILELQDDLQKAEQDKNEVFVTLNKRIGEQDMEIAHLKSRLTKEMSIHDDLKTSFDDSVRKVSNTNPSNAEQLKIKKELENTKSENKRLQLEVDTSAKQTLVFQNQINENLDKIKELSDMNVSQRLNEKQEGRLRSSFNNSSASHNPANPSDADLYQKMYARIGKVKEEKSKLEQLLLRAKADYDALNEVCINLRCQADSRRDKKVRFSDKDDVKYISPQKEKVMVNKNSSINSKTDKRSFVSNNSSNYSKSFQMISEDIKSEISINLNEANVDRINSLTKELVRYQNLYQETVKRLHSLKEEFINKSEEEYNTYRDQIQQKEKELLFTKSQLSDREIKLTEYDRVHTEHSAELTETLKQTKESMKAKDELEQRLAQVESEAEEKVSSMRTELFNNQSLLKERGKQLEELMRTIDVLRGEGQIRDSFEGSQGVSIRQSLESIRNVNFATLDQDRLVTHLYNLSAEICAFSRIEGNYERRLHEANSQLDKLQNDYLRTKSNYDTANKKNNSYDRQITNIIEENKELRSKVEDSESVTKRHFEKIKELCTVLDKLTDENSTLRTDLENTNKNFRSYIDSKLAQLDARVDTHLIKMEEARDSLPKQASKERDSELELLIKNLTSSIKQTGVDKDSTEWVQNITSQLTDIITKTDKKNLSLALSNRLLRQEVESLRNSSTLFNSKLYINFELNLKRVKSLKEVLEAQSDSQQVQSRNLLDIVSRQLQRAKGDVSKFQVQVSVLEKQRSSQEIKLRELQFQVENLSKANNEMQITNPYLQKHLKSQISSDFEELLADKDKEIKEWVEVKLCQELRMERNDPNRALKEDFVNISKEYLALKTYMQNFNTRYNAVTEELDKLSLAFKGLKSMHEQELRKSTPDSSYSLSDKPQNENAIHELNTYRDQVYELEQKVAELIREKEKVRRQTTLSDADIEKVDFNAQESFDIEQNSLKNQLELVSEEQESQRRQMDSRISVMIVDQDAQISELKLGYEAELESLRKRYSEDPAPLKVQIGKLKAEVKSLQKELEDAKFKANDTLKRMDSTNQSRDQINSELEKQKSGIKDFKDIVAICESEAKLMDKTSGPKGATSSLRTNLKKSKDDKTKEKSIYSRLPRLILEKMLYLTNKNHKIEDCMELLKEKCSEQNETIHRLKAELIEAMNKSKYSPIRQGHEEQGMSSQEQERKIVQLEKQMEELKANVILREQEDTVDPTRSEFNNTQEAFYLEACIVLIGMLQAYESVKQDQIPMEKFDHSQVVSVQRKIINTFLHTLESDQSNQSDLMNVLKHAQKDDSQVYLTVLNKLLKDLNTTYSTIQDQNKNFNSDDMVLLQSAVQNMKKSMQKSTEVVNSISNVLYLAKLELKDFKAHALEEAGVDLEDEEQTHIFESLRKTIERQKEKLDQGESQRQALQEESDSIKQTLTQENQNLKNKLGEVYEIQKSLKWKFDSNINLVENAQKSENQYREELQKYEARMKEMTENLEQIDSKSKEAEAENIQLRKAISDSEKVFAEREQIILGKIENQVEEVRKADKKARDSDDMVIAQQDKITELNDQLIDASQQISDYKIKVDMYSSKLHSIESKMQQQSEKFESDMEEMIAKVEKYKVENHKLLNDQESLNEQYGALRERRSNNTSMVTSNSRTYNTKQKSPRRMEKNESNSQMKSPKNRSQRSLSKEMELDNMNNEKVVEVKNEILHLSRVLEDQKNTIAQLMSQKQPSDTVYHQELETFRAQTARVENEVRELQKRNVELEYRAEAAERDIDRFQTEMNSKELEVTKQTITIEKLKNEIETQKLFEIKQDEVSHEKSEQLRKLVATEDALDQMTDELRETKKQASQHQHETQEFRRRIEDLNRALDVHDEQKLFDMKQLKSQQEESRHRWTLEKEEMCKQQDKLKNKFLILIRELKRDFGLEGTSETFNDICDLFQTIQEICIKEAKQDIENKNTKVLKPKPTITSSKLKSNKQSNRSDKEKENKDAQNKEHSKDQEQTVIRFEFPSDYKTAKDFEEVNVRLRDKISLLELELQDKDLEVEDLKTRVDVICLDTKSEKETHKKEIDHLKEKVKEQALKTSEQQRITQEIRATQITPQEQKAKQEELQSRMEEVGRLKAEIKRMNDSMASLKNEKLEMMKRLSLLEENQQHSSKHSEEVQKLKAELARKDKSMANFRITLEELKTDRDLQAEQARSLAEKWKQARTDVERKDKIVQEWKSKQDNLLEKNTLEISDVEGVQKTQDKLRDQVIKLKAEMQRKDTTNETLKNRIKVLEENGKDFESEVKDKQNNLSKDLHELNKKSEQQLKKLRKAELSVTNLKSILLTVYQHLMEKNDEQDRSLDVHTKYNHSEAMRLLEMDETDLALFINTPDDNVKQCALVRLLDMDSIESEEVSRLILDAVNKLVSLEIKQFSSGSAKTSSNKVRLTDNISTLKKDTNVMKKYEDYIQQLKIK